ncbi:MAG: tol-pal system protein YbgF [Burkholderiaceae bacterium]
MTRWLLALTLACAVTPAWALFEDNEARRAILELRSRHEQQEIDVANRMRNLEATVDQVKAAMGGQLALQQEIEALKVEIARLRGLLEEQANELSKTQRSQRAEFAKVDSRIRLVEPVQVQIDGQTVAVERGEQRMFEAALNEFRSGDFDSAERAFEQFRLQFPESAYSPEAMFWLGSSQFALKKYKESITTQAELVDAFPESGRAADALLNKGFAEIELKQKKAARRSFELVQERYPGSSAASTAAQRAKGL